MNTPATSTVASEPHADVFSAAVGHKTVEVRIPLTEYAYIEALFKDVANRSPRFAFCDLLSACVALVFDDADAESQLFRVLHTDVVLRPPGTRRRNAHVWEPQIDTLRRLQNSPRNRHPNPAFNLDQLVTACVAINLAKAVPFGRLYDRARFNTADRASHIGS